MLVFYNGDGWSTLMEFVHVSFRCKQFILKLVVSSSGRFLGCNRDGIGRGRCMFLDGLWRWQIHELGRRANIRVCMVKQNHHTTGRIDVATGNILLPATLTTGIGLAEGGLVEKKIIHNLSFVLTLGNPTIFREPFACHSNRKQYVAFNPKNFF